MSFTDTHMLMRFLTAGCRGKVICQQTSKEALDIETIMMERRHGFKYLGSISSLWSLSSRASSSSSRLPSDLQLQMLELRVTITSGIARKIINRA